MSGYTKHTRTHARSHLAHSPKNPQKPAAALSEDLVTIQHIVSTSMLTKVVLKILKTT